MLLCYCAAHDVTIADRLRPLGVSFSTVHAGLPGGVLPVQRLPGGRAAVLRHHQLSDWHSHRPVGGPRLLPGGLPARVPTPPAAHQAAA